jgi:hypothetical protein
MRERLEEFREVAEHQFELPAFHEIEQRGRARRRRRRTAVGALGAFTASLVAVTGLWTTKVTDPATTPAVDPSASPAAELLFFGVDAPPTVTIDRPEGWTWAGWGTDNRATRARDVARFATVVVKRVAKDPCQISRGIPDYRPTTSDPQRLAAQLASMARVRVVQEPVPDDRFGFPGLYLQLQGTGPACTREADPRRRFIAYQDFADGGGWPDPLGTADVWLVDIGDHIVVVEAVTGARVSSADRDALFRVIDSVEIRPAGTE